MSHDTHCTYRAEQQGYGDTLGNFAPYLPQQPCICEQLTQARADEREQAAQRVEDAMEHEAFCWTDPGPKCICQMDTAIAAARGEDKDHG